MEEKKQQKLSYEELASAASQLSQQNQQLNMMLQQANMTNTFRHLDYLFKVLQFKECFNSEFLISCVDSIVELMTPPTEDGKEE